MLLNVTLRKYSPLTILATVFSILLLSWVLLPHRPWSLDSFKVSLSSIHKHTNTPNLLPVPSIYSEPAANDPACAKRLGTLFLQNASNTSVNYCSNNSSSSLTCFRSLLSTERVDPFCIGTPALFDRDSAKFELGCALSDLTEQQVAAGVPPLFQFPAYWYETGPRTILDKHMKLESGEVALSEQARSSRNFSILVRREGPSPITNLFHHLMQIFSVFLTLDVLQMVVDPKTGDPFFHAEDVKNTRVVIFDKFEDGPFFDQWTAFAKRPLVRIQDLQSDPLPEPENIIIPLAGSANTLWQDDWVPNQCEGSDLLRVFSRRMLDFYAIDDNPGPLDRPLVLTFIARTEKRSLVHKEAYIDSLKISYSKIEINLVDFASLTFAEQLKTIRATDILAGVHGAGLTHGIFLRPGSTMVEIMPPNFNHKGFRNLAKLSGHRYYTTHAQEHANYTTPKGWQTDDVFIEQDRFNGLMDAAIKSMYHRGLRDDDVN